VTALSTRLGVGRTICPGESPVNGQLRAGTGYTVRPGALLIKRDGSSLLEPPLSSAPRFDAVVVGVYESQCQIDGMANADAGLGALDVDDRPILLSARCGSIGYFDTGATVNQITAAHIGRPCYAYDDNTLYLTDNGGTLPFAGLVGDIDANGKIELRNTAAIRAMRALFAEGGSGAAGVTYNGTVRAVVTSLAANAESAGVITADAVGALGAQDGITLVAGDEVFIPEGTTNLDAAADAGPYTVTTVGDGSTAFVLTRPAWWSNGATISPASDVKVAEGTLYGGSTWRTFAAKGAIVGTDAPLAYPNYVGRAATLVAGTVTISNVPLKSATKSTLSINRTTANTTAATDGGYHPSTLTPGALGTASIVVQAQVLAGTINNADISTLNVGVQNW
jgi:hypothetical protein